MRPVKALVVGYGNTLRGDDAVGWRVAEAVDELDLPGVVAYAKHQLTPDFAASLAGVQVAVFVDACSDPSLDQVRVRRVAPSEGTDVSTHHSSPEDLLRLTRALYDVSPSTWAVDVPARDFAFGERMSPLTLAAVPDAIARIREIVGGAG